MYKTGVISCAMICILHPPKIYLFFISLKEEKYVCIDARRHVGLSHAYINIIYGNLMSPISLKTGSRIKIYRNKLLELIVIINTCCNWCVDCGEACNSA
jgi:hypothetical protein